MKGTSKGILIFRVKFTLQNCAREKASFFVKLKSYCTFAEVLKGTVSLFLLHTIMISKDRIVDLAQSFLEGSTNYLIDIRVSSTNKILVFIENDVNVSIQDCIQLSKHIEHSLDREMEDFELEVSSPGIDQPFKNIRQYKKYCGKEVDVLLKNGEKMKGLLSKVEDTSIEIDPSAFKKPVRKITSEINKVKNKNVFLFNDIKETRLHINFK